MHKVAQGSTGLHKEYGVAQCSIYTYVHKVAQNVAQRLYGVVQGCTGSQKGAQYCTQAAQRSTHRFTRLHKDHGVAQGCLVCITKARVCTRLHKMLHKALRVA